MTTHLRYACLALLGVFFVKSLQAQTTPPNDECGTTLYFDGTDDFISFENSLIGSAGTFETWVWKSNWSDHVDDILFGNNLGFSSDNSFYLSLHHNVGLHCRVGSTSENGNFYVSTSATKNLSSATWHHIAVSWRNANDTTWLALYLDGVEVDRDSSIITIDPGNIFQIGSNPESGFLKEARMDEVRVWDHWRSEAEIAAQMNDMLEGNESGLISYYDFNNYGNALLDRAGGNHGILEGPIWQTADGDLPCTLTPPGDICGTVLDFDGVNNTVAIPHYSSLKPEFELSIEAWVYPYDIQTETFYEIYRKEDGGDRHLFSFQGNGTILSFGANIGGSYGELDVTIDPADFENQWVHVAAVYDGATKAVYRNGVLIGSESITGNISTAGSAPAYIGSNNNGNEFFDGLIDELRVWDRALDYADLAMSMDETFDGNEQGLLAYFDFDDGRGSSSLNNLAGGDDGQLVEFDDDQEWVHEDGTLPLEITGTFGFGASCSYTEDGTLTVFSNGGYGETMFSVDSGATFQTSSSFNLAGGDYTVWAVDSLGCSDQLAAIIAAPDPVDVTVTQVGNELTAENTGATYNWLDCDDSYSPIGETTQSITSSLSGNFAVEVTEGGCTDTSDCFNVTITELNGILASEIFIYPNPVNDHFQVDLSGLAGDFELTISTMNGMKLTQRKGQGGEIIQLDIEADPGIYLLEVTSTNLTYQTTIIKN